MASIATEDNPALVPISPQPPRQPSPRRPTRQCHSTVVDLDFYQTSRAMIVGSPLSGRRKKTMLKHQKEWQRLTHPCITMDNSLFHSMWRHQNKRMKIEELCRVPKNKEIRHGSERARLDVDSESLNDDYSAGSLFDSDPMDRPALASKPMRTLAFHRTRYYVGLF
ncbi:hypothetical protein BDF14DRAFT_1775560 [Spinellus fusiger]|nr:hypothetical protein BDF14DRAFT_1775560 [Spinellus fusiger]